MDSLLEHAAGVEPLAVLSRFRRGFHACLTARADELSELADAVLCTDGPVRDLAGLSLAPEHQRGHGALYDAVNCGRVDIGRLRRVLAGLPLPRAADGRLVLAADVSNWLRPGAATSPERLFCHVYGRGKGQAQMIPGWPYQAGTNGRPRKHGRQLTLSSPAACPDPQITTSTATSRYGTAAAAAWDRVHPRLTHRAAWLDHDGNLPVIEGTLIRLQVDYLPGDRDPKPVWLWWSRTGAAPADVDRCWQSFLRRFDLEHTFRFFKQVLGWTSPKVRDPAAADRWTWLIIACYAQLRLARPLAADLRRPWERPAPPGRLTPARVRRGFRNIRAKAGCPAGAPKPGKPGPGRPPGSKNRHLAPRHDMGETTKRELTLKARRERKG